MITLATESNKKQIFVLRKITVDILLHSIKEQERNNALDIVGRFVGVTVLAWKQKSDNSYSPGSWSHNVNDIALAPQHYIDSLESRLYIAAKKIQSMNIKELFDVIRINKHQGPEEAINYILPSIEIPLTPVRSKSIVHIKRQIEIPLTPSDSKSEEP